MQRAQVSFWAHGTELMRMRDGVLGNVSVEDLLHGSDAQIIRRGFEFSAYLGRSTP